jgi:hypothetical protein
LNLEADVKTLWTLLGVAVLSFAHVSHADQVVRGLKDIATITDESGVSRMLFRLDGGIDVPHFAIERATLDLGLVGEAENRGFTLRIHPVTTEWIRGAVDWTNGWTRPGGDFEDDLYSRARVHFGGGSTHGVFDLTVPLKQVLEHDMPADGFILTLAPVDGRGIPAEALARFARLDRATVTIEYKVMPPLVARRSAG